MRWPQSVQLMRYGFNCPGRRRGAKLTKKNKVRAAIELRRHSVIAAVHDQTLLAIERTAIDLDAVTHSDPKETVKKG